MTIHHATLKRAHRQGLHIEEEHGGWSVYRAKITNDTSDAGEPLVNIELLEAQPLVHDKGSAKDALTQAEAMTINDELPDKVLEDEDEDQPAKSGSIVKSTYKESYVDGNCGDELALECTAFLKPDGKKLDMDRWRQLAADNDIDVAPWEAQNNGQKSMNLRNKLRAKWRKGGDIQVGGHVIPGQPQDEDAEKEEAAD
jgi:hypothetical protein